MVIYWFIKHILRKKQRWK